MQSDLAIALARHDDCVVELDDLGLHRLAESSANPLGRG
jgi:hypothetical protein